MIYLIYDSSVETISAHFCTLNFALLIQKIMVCTYGMAPTTKPSRFLTLNLKRYDTIRSDFSEIAKFCPF